MGDFGTCHDCGAPLRWEVMASGRRAPLNREPDAARGNVLLCDEIDAELLGTMPGRAVQLGARDVVVERAKGTDLFLSHFATCPGDRRRT